MLLTVNATSGAVWSCWWLCRKITEKVSSVTIVLRKYHASQMLSSKEPHLARAIGSRPLAEILMIRVNVPTITNLKRHFCPWRNHTNAHSPQK